MGQQDKDLPKYVRSEFEAYLKKREKGSREKGSSHLIIKTIQSLWDLFPAACGVMYYK
jgi:hypothetical protein